MLLTNTLTYNNSNGLYLVCPIGCEIINKVLSHSTLKLVQGVLVHVHTTFHFFFIYCMTHHRKSYVAKPTNNYLTTIRDALTACSKRKVHANKKKLFPSASAHMERFSASRPSFLSRWLHMLSGRRPRRPFSSPVVSLADRSYRRL